jgi:hypothetical protein
MGLLEKLMQASRPELPVSQEIIDKEKEFSRTDFSREEWVLNHIYLCEGDLKELKKHPRYINKGLDVILSYYATPQGKSGPCKPVVVDMLLTMDEKTATEILDKRLKLSLHHRGCNAGIFYKQYKKGGSLYAEAVPATLTSE